MNFVHGDILDKDLIKKYCHDADVVHHLAGLLMFQELKVRQILKKKKKNRRGSKRRNSKYIRCH